MELTDPDGGDHRQVSSEQIVVTDSDKVSEPELGLGGPLVQSVHVLEGACKARVQLADPDERATGTVEVVVPDSNWDAEAKRFSRSLVQPGGLLEGSATWVQLVDPVGCSEVMVKPVHIVVQDSDSDRKAMGVGGTLVESVNMLEGACVARVELADTVVGSKMVAHCADRGRPVGEAVTSGKEAGLRAPLTHDVERPAAEAS